MKRFYITLAITVLFSSCSDFLSEHLTTQISEETAYSTKEALESNISGCYTQMGVGQGWKGGMFEFLQEASGLVHWNANRTEENWLQCLDFTMYSNNTWNEQAFNALNSYIAKANILLYHLPDSPVEQSFKDEIEGEARFIRAVTYFSLVRMYGDLPIHRTPVTSQAESNVPRTPYYKVYEFILEDLDFAEAHMRDAARQKAISGTKGRPNKWAATAYKSLVFLHIGSILDSEPNDQFFDESKPGRKPDFTGCHNIKTAKDAWKLAYDTAESVLVNGPYHLAKDYAQLFRWGWKQDENGEWIQTPEDYQLEERIFVLQSTDNADNNTNYSVQRTVPNFPEGTLNYSAENAQAGRIRPERYVVQRWTKEYGGHVATGRNDKLTGVWIDCKDPRFDASYIHTGYRYNNAKFQEYISMYPEDNCVAKCANTTLTYDDGSTKSLSLNNSVLYKKYIDHLYNAGKGNADFYMMRLAEVYLISAEAAASLSESKGDEMWTKALSRVEDIHKRARGELSPDARQSSEPTWNDGDHNFVTRQDLIHAIMWERVYELGGEGHEFFDTHRRGAKYLRNQIAMPINEFLDLPEQNGDEKSGYFKYQFLGKYFPTKIEDIRKGLLCAFPDPEIRYNQAISYEDQNDFYVR